MDVNAKHKHLYEYSRDMVLAAIEIYNKPVFPNREQVFCILIVNAWEILLKAKILKDHHDDMSCLYVRNGNEYKKDKDDQFLTININKAIELCNIRVIVKDNLYELIKIRNTAIHLTEKSAALPKLVFSLGTGALQNYIRLMKEWFGVSLNEYNFYILPVGFSYPFHSFTVEDMKNEPEDIVQILESVVNRQEQGFEQDGFHFTCEIKIVLSSAKKATAETDFEVGLGNSDTSPVVVQKKVKPTDMYPYTYSEAWDKIHSQVPELKRKDFNSFIKEYQIKGDESYSTYHYRSKNNEHQGIEKSTHVTYNENFIRFCIAHFSQE